MKLDFDRIMGRANAYYAEAKFKKEGVPHEDILFMAPEHFPVIGSDQVKAVLKALIEEINKEEHHGR